MGSDAGGERVAYIDGLRGAAALSVLVCHAASGALSDPLALHRSTALERTAAHVLVLGRHGVELFFVLSGFCLAYPTFVRFARHGRAELRLAAFFARRVVRIYPPYAAAVLLSSAACAIALNAAPSLWDHRSFAPAETFAQLAFLDRHATYVNDAAFWTLPLEWRWYAAFPLALALWMRAPRLFLAFVALVPVLDAFTLAGSADLFVLPSFLLGIAAAACAVDGIPRRWAFATCCALVTVAAAEELHNGSGVPPLVAGNEAGAFAHLELLWQAAAFCAVVYAGQRTALRDVLGSRPFVALGTMSYSLYLVHVLAVIPCERALDGRMPFFAIVTSGIAAGLLAGAAFWCAFERPVTHGSARAPMVRGLNRAFERIEAFLGMRPFVFARGSAERPIALTTASERQTLAARSA